MWLSREAKYEWRRETRGMGNTGWVLLHVYAKRMSGFEDKLLSIFKLAVDMVQKFMYYSQKPPQPYSLQI